MEILFEDNHIIVVQKPQNVLSQGDETGDQDMLGMVKNYIKEKYQKPGNVYVGLVHRLDRPTGGVMVFANTSKAASRLCKEIQDGTLKKEYLTVYGYLLFPEVLSVSGPKKYNRYALWLATQKGILNTNVRDGFSAGGKCLLRTVGGVEVSMPAAFGRIKKYKHLIEEYISSIDESILSEYWETDINEDRLSQWCKMVCRSASTDPNINPKIAWLVLEGIFPQIIR